MDSLRDAAEQLVRDQLLGFRGTLTAGHDRPWQLSAATGENRAAVLAFVLGLGVLLGVLMARK